MDAETRTSRLPDAASYATMSDPSTVVNRPPSSDHSAWPKLLAVYSRASKIRRTWSFNVVGCCAKDPGSSKRMAIAVFSNRGTFIVGSYAGQVCGGLQIRLPNGYVCSVPAE